MTNAATATQTQKHFDDLVGLLHRMVRDAARPTERSTGQKMVEVPSLLLKEGQELLEKIDPALVQHFRAF